METENPKPQTGGLKLMTVFIVVLALHVVVIGGISAYHLLKRGSSEAGDIAQKDQPTENLDATKGEPTAEPLQADANGTTPPVVATEEPQVTTNQTTQPVTPTDPTASALTPPQPVNPPVNNTVVPPAPIQTHEVKNTVVEPASATVVEVTVKAGDSLYKIARQNHTTVDSIKKLNSLSGDNLKIGQKLKVASKNAPTSAPQATAVASTPAPKIAKAPKAVAVSTGKTVYTVSKGDTLTKIAKHFNTTPAAIMTANGISDPHKLSIGAKLKIPVQEARNQTTPVPAAAAPKAAPAPSNDLVMNR